MGQFSACAEHVMLDSVAKDSSVSTYYSVIFVLSDLRDQAGRVASNIIAAVTFAEKFLKPIWRALCKPNAKPIICGI